MRQIRNLAFETQCPKLLDQEPTGSEKYIYFVITSQKHMQPFFESADDALRNRVFDSPVDDTAEARGMFPYLPAHKQVIIGRDELIIMECHHDRNTPFFERPN